jgi:hypothetical protein
LIDTNHLTDTSFLSPLLLPIVPRLIERKLHSITCCSTYRSTRTSFYHLFHQILFYISSNSVSIHHLSRYPLFGVYAPRTSFIPAVKEIGSHSATSAIVSPYHTSISMTKSPNPRPFCPEEGAYVLAEALVGRFGNHLACPSCSKTLASKTPIDRQYKAAFIRNQGGKAPEGFRRRLWSCRIASGAEKTVSCKGYGVRDMVALCWDQLSEDQWDKALQDCDAQSATTDGQDRGVLTHWMQKHKRRTQQALEHDQPGGSQKEAAPAKRTPTKKRRAEDPTYETPTRAGRHHRTTVRANLLTVAPPKFQRAYNPEQRVEMLVQEMRDHEDKIDGIVDLLRREHESRKSTLAELRAVVSRMTPSSCECSSQSTMPPTSTDTNPSVEADEVPQPGLTLRPHQPTSTERAAVKGPRPDTLPQASAANMSATLSGSGTTVRYGRGANREIATLTHLYVDVCPERGGCDVDGGAINAICEIEEAIAKVWTEAQLAWIWMARRLQDDEVTVELTVEAEHSAELLEAWKTGDNGAWLHISKQVEAEMYDPRGWQEFLRRHPAPEGVDEREWLLDHQVKQLARAAERVVERKVRIYIRQRCKGWGRQEQHDKERDMATNQSGMKVPDRT